MQKQSFVDALLALPHKPTQLFPCANARDSGRCWALPCDDENAGRSSKTMSPVDSSRPARWPIRSAARVLATRLRERHIFTLQRVPLCLGRLESSDFVPLSAVHKEAVQAFWTDYFSAGGEPSEIRFDGTVFRADADRGCSDEKR